MHKEEEKEEECVICLNTSEDTAWTQVSVCQHRFHTLCFQAWIQRVPTCPLCREPIYSEPLLLQIHTTVAEMKADAVATTPHPSSALVAPLCGGFLMLCYMILLFCTLQHNSLVLWILGLIQTGYWFCWILLHRIYRPLPPCLSCLATALHVLGLLVIVILFTAPWSYNLLFCVDIVFCMITSMKACLASPWRPGEASRL